MPPAKRDLSKMMWIWGGGAVVMFVACMVIANFFFPTAEESGYLEDLVREKPMLHHKYLEYQVTKLIYPQVL